MTGLLHTSNDSRAGGARGPAARRAAIYAAAWPALGLLFSGQYLLENHFDGEPLQFAAAVGSGLGFWCVWGAVAPGLWWIGTQLRPGAVPHVVSLLAHALSAAAFAALHVVVRYALNTLVRWEPERPMGELFASTYYFNLLLGGGVLAAAHAARVHRHFRAREQQSAELRVRTAELDAELATANLELLRSQLEPHFLFNTLQAISTLIGSDPAAADRMLGQVSELLRYALECVRDPQVPLRAELHFAERYVAIQQVRLEERLRVEWEVDPQALDVLVPSMLLHPLIENAIEHGVARRPQGGVVMIRIRNRGPALEVTIRNDGTADPPPRARQGAAVGLANTRERLHHQYGPAASLTLDVLPGGGAELRLVLPSAPPAGARLSGVEAR